MSPERMQEPNFTPQLGLCYHARRAVRGLIGQERVHDVARVGSHCWVAAILSGTTKASDKERSLKIIQGAITWLKGLEQRCSLSRLHGSSP